MKYLVFSAVTIFVFICLLIAFTLWYILYRNHMVSFGYIPKKSKEIYEEKLAHRGLHLCSPENTLKAVDLAIKNNIGVEIDVRLTKDEEIVLFHDRYTKRLLGIPGKLSIMKFDKLMKYSVLGSNEKIATLQEVFEIVDGKQTILIEIKCKMNRQFISTLLGLLYEYRHYDKVYFHTKNMRNYLKLRHVFGDRVFLVCNPFRKRFNFIKGRDYKKVVKHLNGYASMVNEEYVETKLLEPFSLDDIAQVLTESVEENDTVQEIIAKISGALNHQNSRICHDEPIRKWPIAHRGIVSSKYRENSRESIEECIQFAISRNTGIVIELDMQMYKGEVILYHDDTKSNILGQKTSCSDKLPINEAMRLEELFNIELVKKYKDRIAFIFDDKSTRRGKTELQIKAKSVFEKIQEQGYLFYVQAANPFVLNWYHQNIPSVKRGMVGNSIPSIKTTILRMKNTAKTRVFTDMLRQAIAFLWFDLAESDYCVYDYSNYIYIFMKYCKGFRGKPILIYAPKSLGEIESMVGNELVDAYVMEDIANESSWPIEYMKERFKPFDSVN
ncbi:MAG: glycerophosphodiester phosphodiesterase family protein [Clostridia bacterium]|nr:glycerophosphodiester phosphodiesterase family protein [Clostridia bacterium]